MAHPAFLNHLFSSPAEMKQSDLNDGIVSLLNFIDKLESGKEENWKQVGIDLRLSKKHEIVRSNLDRAHWQLTMYYKYCRPTQIGKAVKHIKWVIENNKDNKVSKVDVNPLYTLGVALVKSEKGSEKETKEEARKIFAYAFSNITDEDASLRSALWARSYYSRLLHDLGEDKEARKQENFVSRQYDRNKFLITPSEFIELVTEENTSPKDNPILKNIPNFGVGITELGPQHASKVGPMFRNGMVFTNTGGPDYMVFNAKGADPTTNMVDMVLTHCASCGVDNPKNTCGKCKLMKYCSRDCQAKHWKDHKLFCYEYTAKKVEAEEKEKEKKEKEGK